MASQVRVRSHQACSELFTSNFSSVCLNKDIYTLNFHPYSASLMRVSDEKASTNGVRNASINQLHVSHVIAP